MILDLMSAYKRIRHWFGDDGILQLSGFESRPTIRVTALKLGTSFNSEFVINIDDDYASANNKLDESIRLVSRMIENYKMESK